MLFLLFFTLLVELIFGKVWVLSCNSDKDCSEGYFCFQKYCRKCLKCNLLFRKGNSCVIDFDDCEGCLPGYEEVLITDFSTSVKSCKLMRKKVKFKICSNRNECPPSHYCNGDFCVKCFDCTLMNRLQPGKKCAKGLEECGACMIGFSEVAVTSETNFKVCEKNIWTISEQIDSFKQTSSNVGPVFYLTVLFVVAIVTLLVRCHKDCNSTKNTYKNPIRPSAPPLYIMDMPQCIKKQELTPETHCVEKQEMLALPYCVKKQEETESSFVSFIKEKKQMAKVFKQPDALYYVHTEKDLQEMNNVRSNEMNSSENIAETRRSSWVSASSALPGEINCSAAIMIHSYLDLSDCSRNLSVPHSSKRSSNIILDVVDGTSTENSVQEVKDNVSKER